MKEIPLTHGKVAQVDDEDFERTSKFRWCAKKPYMGRRNLWYAYRFVGRKDRNHKIVQWLHHFIQGSKHQTDHCDGNGLNNQKRNLRFCTSSQNAANRRLSSNNSTGFKGVTKHRGKFVVQLGRKGSGKWIGVFDSPEDAARAYDCAAIDKFGQFARLNFPTEKHPHSAI